MKRLLILLLLSSAVISLEAQQADTSRSIMLHALRFSNGAAWINESPAGINELKKMAPDMEMLDRDRSGYDFGNSYFSDISFAYGFMTEWTHKKLRTARFRFGIDMNQMQTMSANYTRQESVIIGTGTTPNGYPYQVDSTVTEEYNFAWHYQQTGITFGYAFQTRESRRFSAWLGLQANINLLFNNYISGDYSGNTRVRIQPVGGYGGSNGTLSNSRVSERQISNLPVSAGYRLMMPVGAQIILSKRRRILSHLYFTAELVKGIEFVPIKNSGLHVRSFNTMQTGIRYRIPQIFQRKSYTYPPVPF